MGILSLLIGPLTSLLGRLLPDPAAAQAAKLKLLEMMQSGALADLDASSKESLAAANIVKAEASSEGWLTRSWRPLVMLVFTGLIVARMFGYTAPNVSAPEYLELWSLVKLGLGGYVIGRTAEKSLPSIMSAIKGVKS